ncbi:MAG: O-methyltransferase [Actinomycetota bacterium]|nr:O-methyltransferase [Actinomycetota bacterium]
MNDSWAEVDSYLVDRLVTSDEVLDAASGGAAVSANQGKLLQLLAQAIGARCVLEIGTLAGYSTIWLARALPPGGRLVTLEADPGSAEVARSNIAEAGLSDIVELRVGAALESLPRLRGPFDLIFLDADKAENLEYLVHALELSRPGTLIVADNVVRGGAVIDVDSDDGRVQGVRRFFDLLNEEPRLTATAIQTVGSKGWDGFALALVGE